VVRKGGKNPAGTRALRRKGQSPPGHSPSKLSGGSESGTAPATRPLSYRQLKPTHGPALPGLILQVRGGIEFFVVIDAEHRANSGPR